MNLFKRVYENLTKTLSKADNKQTVNIPKAYNNHTKNVSETNLEITLNSANNQCEFPFRVFLIIGKPETGKTTLSKNIAGYYERNGVPIVNVKTLEDLEKQKCVLIIDDLKDNLTKAIFNRIVEKFRIVRHNQQIIILTHHILSDVPTRLIKLAEKVIMFNNSFSPNSPTSKVHHIIPKSRKNELHELVLTLNNYEYVVIKNGKVFGKFSNMNITPIVGDTNGKEVLLINGSKNGCKNGFHNGLNGFNGNGEKFRDLIYEKVPEFDFLTITDKIIVLKQTFPRLKPKVISQMVGTTPQNTWKTLSIARKKGLI
jgi:calcineurin-like phosphoesterase family protein